MNIYFIQIIYNLKYSLLNGLDTKTQTVLIGNLSFSQEYNRL